MGDRGWTVLLLVQAIRSFANLLHNELIRKSRLGNLRDNGRMRSWLIDAVRSGWHRNRTAAEAERIPADVRARLLKPLFERRHSITNGGVSGILLGGIVVLSTSAAWVSWWLVAHTFVFAMRLLHIARCTARTPFNPLAEAITFGVGGFLSAFLWGVLGGLSLFLLEDAVLQAAVVITASGLAGGTASRNAGYPSLAKLQVAATLMLTSLGGAARGEPVYLFIAMLCILHTLSLISLVTRLHADELSLLLTSRERAAMAEALASQNERFQAALENMSHGFCIFDSTDRVIVHNSRFGELIAHGNAEVFVGRSIDNLFRTKRLGIRKQLESVKTKLAKSDRAEFQHILPDGRALSLVFNPMPSGGTVVVCSDVTERLRTEANLAYLARHDPLTGLLNRRHFIEAVSDALSGAGPGKGVTAVLCLDLDRFKGVNDTLGHPAGDALLRSVAARLSETVSTEGIVARFGGDEFSVLLEKTSLSAAKILAERLIHALSAPYCVDEQQALIGASVGIALAPLTGTDPEGLMKRADLALYHAKSSGKGVWRAYETSMTATAQVRRQLEIELREALVQGCFELHYQPCIDVVSGQTTGCEALLRWRHPSKGLVPPEEFISLAEEVGSIVPIGDWVLRQACHEAASWPEPLRVSVNVSAIQFRAGTVVHGVMAALTSSGLPPHRLELEVTESALVENEAETLKALAQLRSLGVLVAMDDFGTGYSSLSYLRSFPFDRIKIDRAFVREVSDNEECRAIVRAIIALGSNLGIAVTAEGVETDDQLDFVRDEGCAEAQGYRMSLPLDVVSLRDYLASDAVELSTAA